MWSRGQTDDRSFTMPKSLSLEQGLDHHGAVERDANRPQLRALISWTCLATSSLPVPLSPSIGR
jgi:hypothetical protein